MLKLKTFAIAAVGAFVVFASPAAASDASSEAISVPVNIMPSETGLTEEATTQNLRVYRKVKRYVKRRTTSKRRVVTKRRKVVVRKKRY